MISAERAIQETETFFPYWYQRGGKRCCLLWIPRESAPDSFFVDREGKPLCFSSKKRLQCFLGERSEQIDWAHEGRIDFDEFWSAVRGLRVNRASSTRTCAVLLEGWNFLEDILRSSQATGWLKKLGVPLMRRVYDKLYYGNNLPAVTPRGRSYNPLWAQEELVHFRRTLNELWPELIRSGRLPF